MRAPGADWLQVIDIGTVKLDVRLTTEADDGSLIYMTYNGVARHSDISEEKYDWLNQFQLLGKMTKLQSGADGLVEYDIFILR